MLPDVGFCCAASGSRIPPVVFSSASATLARTRSPLGLTCAKKECYYVISGKKARLTRCDVEA